MAQHIPIDSFDFKPEVKEAILEMWDNGEFSMIEDFSIGGMLRYDLDNEWIKEDKRLKDVMVEDGLRLSECGVEITATDDIKQCDCNDCKKMYESGDIDDYQEESHMEIVHDIIGIYIVA